MTTTSRGGAAFFGTAKATPAAQTTPARMIQNRDRMRVPLSEKAACGNHLPSGSGPELAGAEEAAEDFVFVLAGRVGRHKRAAGVGEPGLADQGFDDRQLAGRHRDPSRLAHRVAEMDVLVSGDAVEVAAPATRVAQGAPGREEIESGDP